MDAINNKSVNDAALRSCKTKLKKLERAVNRVELPEFGKCGRCGNDIRYERILFMPESSYCVNCARRM